jgi:hypothetical protein
MTELARGFTLLSFIRGLTKAGYDSFQAFLTSKSNALWILSSDGAQ